MSQNKESPVIPQPKLPKSLEQWLEYIRGLHPEEISLGLDRAKSLAQRAQLLNFDCPIVIVGGTNGKGSTVSSLEALLRASGLKVGAYFSPHLFRFNERVLVGGQIISDAALCQAFEKIEAIRVQDKTAHITVFEFITLAALYIFKKARCDILLLEVGLGGRLDVVNILEPTLSIVTTLGFDHMDRLGNTLEEIATEKAGIFRKNKLALVGQQANHPKLLSEAHRLESVILEEGVDFGWETQDSWRTGNQIFEIPENTLPQRSLSLALAAFECLKSYFPKLSLERIENLKEVLQKAVLPGRCQRIINKVETILDVAHNPQGAQWLKEKLETQNNIAVWSSFKDKDLKGIIASIQEVVATWVIAPLDNERAASLDLLKQSLEEQGIDCARIFCESSLALAYKKAYSLANEQDKILVFGSFATVNEVLCSLE